MTTTTIGDILGRAEHLAHALPDHPTPLPRKAWLQFDATAYRLLDRVTDLPPASSTHHASALTRLRDAYPVPLVLLNQRRTYSIPQYAAHIGRSPDTVYRHLHQGLLPTTSVKGRTRIDARFPPDPDDLTPADPASSEPLDRLSATLGAIADLLSFDPHPTTPPPTQGDRDALAGRILAITAVTARHALARIPLAHGTRPLLIGRYAEYGLDALGHQAAKTPLDQIASFHPPTTPHTPIEHLETALRHWSAAARDEIDRSIPSTAVLANIASQGTHLYAVAHQITLARAELGHLPVRHASLARREFQHTAGRLDHLARQWSRVTTAQRPTHGYVSAARDLDDTLTRLTHHQTRQRTAAELAARIDLDQTMTELRYTATDLRQLIHDAIPLPRLLADSGLLFAPARTLRPTPTRITAARRGRYIAVTPDDITTLTAAVREAAKATRRGTTAVTLTTETPRRHVDCKPEAIGARPAHPEL